MLIRALLLFLCVFVWVLCSQEKHDQTLQYADYLQGLAQPAVDLFEDKAKVAALEAEGGLSEDNIARMGQALGITADNVDKVYEFGKFMYDCGNYGEARGWYISFWHLNSFDAAGCCPQVRNAQVGGII